MSSFPSFWLHQGLLKVNITDRQTSRCFSHILVVLLFVVPLLAEEYTLSGRVIDAATGEPVFNANVLVVSVDRGAATNARGRFVIDDLPEGEHTLLVSHIGYVEAREGVRLPYHGDFTIELRETYFQMKEIVVTGTRTERYLKDVPVTTQVIKGEKLRETGAADVSELLDEVTGVSVVQNQFGTGLELLGFGSEHILVMLDGMKMVGRVNGVLDAAQIPISQIERIEIVRGATSALYGSDAMGGVINIMTKKPSNSWTMETDANFGNYGKVNGSFSLGGGRGNWHSRVLLSHLEYSGYDLTPSSIIEDGNSYAKRHGQLRIRRDITEGSRIRLEVNYFDEKQSLIGNEVYEDVTFNDRLALSLKGELDNVVEMQIRTGLEYSTYNHRVDNIVLSSNHLYKSSLTQERLVRGDILFEREFGRHRVNGGYALELESSETDRILNHYRESYLNNLFLQDEISFSPKIVALAGVRLDFHSIYGKHLSPKISVMFKPGMVSRIRLSYGEGFRAPSFKELFWDYANMFVGYHIEGNPLLRPETSRSVNLDIERWSPGRYHGRVSLFHNQIKNLIDFTYQGIREDLGIWATENIDSAWSRGLELDMTYMPLTWLEIRVGYAYLDSWDEATKSPLSFKAKQKGQAAFVFKVSRGVKLNLRTQFSGKKFYWAEDEQTGESEKVFLHDYSLIHAHLSFPIIWGLRGNAGGRNLTDYVDREGGIVPGREWYAGVSYDFQKED
ncbi:MAG: TonB-dependent receptor [Candidatus Neomarinimicrobiota bacterium]